MGKRGRPSNPPTAKKMLKGVLPVADIFDDGEVELYNTLVSLYLEDFDTDDLTASDMDDIWDLAKNRVLEFRLLKDSKGKPDRQLDIAAAIERLGKKNEKIKENLSSRRKDRINPNEFKGFSIVDLAAAFDNNKKLILEEKAIKLKKAEKAMKEKREDYTGNRYDADVKERTHDDDK